jgi:hypothetical protein
MRPSAAGPALRWGALAALAGGLAAVVGVFLDWAALTSVGTVLAPVETVRGVAGIRHWTGFVALLAAGVAVLGALGAGFFEDAVGRRSAALVAAGGALSALLAVGLGFSQREAIATTGFPGGREALAFARDFAQEFNAELDLDIPPPRVETGPGLPVAAVGSVVAAAGGLLAVRQEAHHRGGLHFGR